MWTAMEDFAIPCSQELRATHVHVPAPVCRRDPLGRFVHHLVTQMGYCPSPGAPSRSPETRTHLTEQIAQVRARRTLLPASRTQLCLRRHCLSRPSSVRVLSSTTTAARAHSGATADNLREAGVILGPEGRLGTDPYFKGCKALAQGARVPCGSC